MNPAPRTPLAWKNLTHDLRRLAIAVSGVTFAVVLMFFQRGFRESLFDSTVELVRNLDADLLIVSRARYMLASSNPFPSTKIDLARGCRHVESVHGLYVELVLSTLRPPSRRSRPIRVIGFDPQATIFTENLAARVTHYRDILLTHRTALIDTTSKSTTYRIDDLRSISSEHPQVVELADKQLQLVGHFDLGTDFVNDGTLLMSLDNFSFYFPHRAFPRQAFSAVDLGLVRVCPRSGGADNVQKELQDLLGKNVLVLTRDELVKREMRVWNENTPIGLIFLVGLIMGFVVGVLICYQVLFNDISNHMSEFATLMAMGYGRSYFIQLVVRESVYLALLGFVPGVVISYAAFLSISAWTGLIMRLGPSDAALILLFTVAMCVISGLLAVRKLLAADPANLF